MQAFPFSWKIKAYTLEIRWVQIVNTHTRQYTMLSRVEYLIMLLVFLITVGGPTHHLVDWVTSGVLVDIPMPAPAPTPAFTPFPAPAPAPAAIPLRYALPDADSCDETSFDVGPWRTGGGLSDEPEAVPAPAPAPPVPAPTPPVPAPTPPVTDPAPAVASSGSPLFDIGPWKTGGILFDDDGRNEIRQAVVLPLRYALPDADSCDETSEIWCECVGGESQAKHPVY